MNKISLALLVSILPVSLLAGEGKWTPQQVLELDAKMLKKQGLEIPVSKLWDPSRGTGLLSGTVNIGSCSGGFISNTGLIITNHHCIFSILQQHSTPKNDLITNGFLARSRAEELAGKSIRVTVPRRFIDVTREIEAAVAKGSNDLARHRAIEAKQKQMVADCEKTPGMRCKVAAFDNGVAYTLIESLEIQDVRLVYAPPRAIGEYGGETDNWMWPRHTGDFSIARAYVTPEGKPLAHDAANVPYKPEFFFPIARKGIQPGDFVMVLGYPGVTYRSLVAEEMEERKGLYFARREEIYGQWIRILEDSTKGNAAGEIAVAGTLKTLLNRYKNAQGQIAGFNRGKLLERQRSADEAVATWAKSRPDMKASVAAREGLQLVVAEQRKTWEHDFLLSLLPVGPRSLWFAHTLAHTAAQKQKADVERETDYMERNLPRLKEKLEREEKNFFAPADKQLLVSFVQRALALPADQRIESVDRLFGRDADEKKILARVEEMFAATKVLDQGQRLRMFGESSAELRARKDPLLDLAIGIDMEVEQLKQKEDRWKGAISRLRPVWRRAVIAHAGKPVAPDANSTLRVSFAHVKGYEPRDGVAYKPQTSLRGVVEKHTGLEPFDVPEPVLAAARAGNLGKWKDPVLGDVPVGFLADADTTGGNSGSPVVNGRGELVGVNFDRVWENVANDFGYNPDIARNVSADVRYMLWLLDKVDNATALLQELGVRE